MVTARTPQAVVGRRLIALLLAAASHGALAIDLLESYQAAREHDATYQAARAARESGREAVPQARAQLLPYVSAGYTRSRLDTASPSYTGQPGNRLDYISENQSLTLRQPLLRKTLWAGYAQAQHQAGEAEAGFERESQDLAVRVATAYFDILLAQESLQLSLAQKASITALLAGARAGFARGEGTRTDIDEAQARLDQVRADELAARQHIDYTRHQLEVLVDRRIDGLERSLGEAIVFLPLATPDLEVWQQQAEAANPEIRAGEAQVGAAEQQVEKGRAGHYPTVDLVVQRALSSGENLNSPLSNFRTTSMGVQMNIPIFAGGFTQSTIRQAQADRDKVRQQLEATRRRIALNVRKEFQNISEGTLRIEALAQAVQSTAQMLASTRKSQAAGLRSRLDVLDAEQRLVNARRDLAEARVFYLLSHVRLAALVGNADGAKMVALNEVLVAQPLALAP